MAYTDEQKKRHIYELQTYLHAISLMNAKIPPVTPNGVYDSATVEAVKAFQREYGLAVTGDTDYDTWNRVVKVYLEYLNSAPLPYHAFPSGKFVTHNGETGQLVYILQAMLNSVGESYDNMPCIDVCGKYDDATETAVKLFQEKSGIAQSGEVDCATWNMLVNCCEHINSTKT